MASRGKRSAKEAAGFVKELTSQSGQLEDWINKMEAKRSAQKLEMPLRRPGKEIAASSTDGPNGPNGLAVPSGLAEHSIKVNLKTTSKAKACDNFKSHVRGKEAQTDCNFGPIGPNGPAKKVNFVEESNGKTSASVPSQVPGSSTQHQTAQAAQAKGSENAENSNARGKFGSKGSWADKIRASSAKSRFCLDSDLAQKHGQTVYSLPDEYIDEDFGDWTRCLVGFIPGSPFPFYAARAIALREWKNYGIETVYTYEGFFIFRFQNEEKVQEVLADGPWLFGGKFMMLQQWNACFVFDKSKLSKVPVWVKLKGLPFTLWSSKALSFAAGIVGKPLSCDRATHERSRLSYARVCVEVDASKPYVHDFVLNCKLSSEPIRVGVEYEWKPQRCPKCCVYGHNCEVNFMEGQKVDSEPRKEVEKENLATDVNLEKSAPGVILEDDVLEEVDGRETITDVNGRNKIGTITYADKLVGRDSRTASESPALVKPQQTEASPKVTAVTAKSPLVADFSAQQEISEATRGANLLNSSQSLAMMNAQSLPLNAIEADDSVSLIGNVDSVTNACRVLEKGESSHENRVMITPPGGADPGCEEDPISVWGKQDLVPHLNVNVDSVTRTLDFEANLNQEEVQMGDSTGASEDFCSFNAATSLGSGRKEGSTSPKHGPSVVGEELADSGKGMKSIISKANSIVERDYSLSNQRQKKKGKKGKGVRPRH